MPKLSPREAVSIYQVSRATLTKALETGKISAEKTDAGHWLIEPSELARLYQPRAPQKAVSRTRPEQVSRVEPDHKLASDDLDIAVRLARTEAALEAEREKTALLERNLDDLRRMLPPPSSGNQSKRWSWWPW